MIYKCDFKNSLDSNECIISISTTGINRQKNKIFLINTILGGEKGKIIQYFLREDGQKEELLDFFNTIKDFEIISYNGKSFDIPFINEYLIKNNMNLIENKIFDIYLFLKNYKFLDTESLKLKNIYEHFSSKKYEMLEQKDNIKIYKNYLKKYDEKDLEILLEQGKLSVIYRYEIHHFFNEKLRYNSINFTIFGLDFIATPYDYSINKNFFNISLINLNKNKNELNYISDYFSINSNKDFLIIKYKIIEGLIDEKTNAICTIYPYLNIIIKDFPNINRNLIPIKINGEFNNNLILELVKDSLKNKNMLS